MHIRYGFDIELALTQPTTILTLMDVHSDQRGGIVEETELQLSHDVPTAHHRSPGQRPAKIVGERRTLSLQLEGVFQADGCEDMVDRAAEAADVSVLPPNALPFLLPSRYCETDLLSGGVGELRRHSRWLGQGTGGLRFRS